jgi:excisionase family DNA binding protein
MKPVRFKKNKKTKPVEAGEATIRSLRGEPEHFRLMKELIESRRKKLRRAAGNLRRDLGAAAKEQQILTTADAALLSGYSRDHIGLLIRRGLLSGVKTGRDWLVPAGSLLQYVETNPRPGPKGV